jgi:hypothetical protein
VNEKWDDCLVVWYEWKWEESERKESNKFIKWHKRPCIIKILKWIYIRIAQLLYTSYLVIKKLHIHTKSG